MKNTSEKIQSNKYLTPEIKRKILRILTWASIFFTLVFMTIALFQFEHDDTAAVAPNQVELYLNQSWMMASFDSSKIPKTELDNQDSILKQIEDTLTNNNYQEVSLPYTGELITDDIIVFKNTLSDDYAGMALSFTSTDTNIRVIIDGAILYQYSLGTSDSFGVHENIVNLPLSFQKGELWIELSSPYSNTVSISDVKIETREMVMIGLVGNNITDISCCLLMVMMAIIMFMLALIRRCTNHPIRGELFLGLYGLTAGTFCFIGTNTLSLFYNIQEAYVMQEYFLLLLPIFLARYYEQNFQNRYPRRFSILLSYVNINAVIQILLHQMGIQDLQNMVLLSIAEMCIVCIIVIISLIQFHSRNKLFQIIVSVFPVLLLLVGETIALIDNLLYVDTYSTISAQYSMTVFSIMMAAMHTLQLAREYRADAEETAQLLHEKVTMTQQQNTLLAQAKQEADAARHEAQTANEAKGKFLAQMSHEIRTPINAVLGMNEMILRESKEQTIKEYAMDIYMAGQTLLSLINDILDLSKIDSGKMEIVPVEYDFSSLIHDLVNMTSQRAKAKNIQLEVEVDPEIPCQLYGDDVRIRQVLTNLLTNAVKYTPEGTVWLRVQSRKINQIVHLKFEVEDTGTGIKEEDLPKLFAEFERIEENKNRNIEGTGLGMSITIQLLSLLGSKLQVESIYGTGSKFYFELQQKIVDAAPLGDFKTRIQQSVENYNYQPTLYAPDAKILVVDDNAVNRKVFCNLLKKTQIQVTDAQSGMECLELVQENHYDLIFLDHMMPEMDGIETLHRIKALSNFPCEETPIIVLTANAISGAKEKYLSEGFDGFLSKPIVPDKLEHMVQTMLPQALLKEAVPDPDCIVQESFGKNSAIVEESFEELPQVEGLDWHYAWRHLQDMSLLEYTIKQFYAQIDSAADTLTQTFVQVEEFNQFESYRIQVHAMKGLSATVGILPLSGIAQLLEHAAREQNKNIIMSVTPIFMENWRSYHQKLQGVFGIENSTKKEMTDTSVIQALVEMIRFSMQEMDIDKADPLIAELQTYKYSDEMANNIQKLAESVTNLDPDETDRLADQILEQIKL